MLLKCFYNNWFACRLAWIINLTDFKRKARMQLQWNPALWWYRSPHYYGHFFWPLAKRPYIFLQKKPLLIRWPINTAKFFTPLVTILMGFHCSVHLRHIILKYLHRTINCDRLTPRTPDLEVWCSSLARQVVSLDKEFYSTVSLFTQVYKKVNEKQIPTIFFHFFQKKISFTQPALPWQLQCIWQLLLPAEASGVQLTSDNSNPR